MNNELIIENRYKIDAEISNTRLRKLCAFYKSGYYKNNKNRTIAKLQYILNVRYKKDKCKRIQQKQECAICYEVLTHNMLITRCMHAYCDRCIINYLSMYANSCPNCRHFYNVYMFISDNQLTFIRMIELFPMHAMNYLWNIENRIVENTITGQNLMTGQNEQNAMLYNITVEDVGEIDIRDGIIGYSFIHYLQNIWWVYNRLILLIFILFTFWLSFLQLINQL